MKLKLLLSLSFLVIFLVGCDGGGLDEQTEVSSSFQIQTTESTTQVQSQLEVDKQTNNILKLGKSYDEIYELIETYEEMDIYIQNKFEEELEDDYSGNFLESENNYSQTNIQVDGIDEGDVIKTDGNYIYVVSADRNYVTILEADSDKVSKVSKIEIGEYSIHEIYVKNDKLIIIYTNYDDIINTEIAIYDISNKKIPKLVNELTQNGYSDSTRLVGDLLYVFSTYDFFDEATEKIPMVNGKQMPYDCIYLPEKISNMTYFIITSIDINDLSDFKDKKAIIGGYGQLYISEKNIYITRQKYEEIEENVTKTLTTIDKFSYNNGIIEFVAQNDIDGYINNSFSMDEYNNNLRIVVTSETIMYNEMEEKDTETIIEDIMTSIGLKDNISNSLYILDENLNIIGSINNLAEDERIYSARFMGNTGYFVTYKQVDPLFSVDLSNPTNPKVIGELKIPGFSTYLHFYGDNLLLGIGQNAVEDQTDGIKLSMFDISNSTDVKEIDTYYLDKELNSDALYSYKNIMIDVKENLFGFSTYKLSDDIDNSIYYYKIFSYDNKKGFQVKLDISLSDNQEGRWLSNIRGLYINDNIYILYSDFESKSSLKIQVYDKNTFEYLKLYEIK